MGRLPILHPPKEGRSAFPLRAINAPNKVCVPLKLCFSLRAIFEEISPRVSNNTPVFVCSTETPISLRISKKCRTSKMFGTFFMCICPLIKRAAERTGNAAFFAPEILTVPLRGTPPLIFKYSIFYSFH